MSLRVDAARGVLWSGIQRVGAQLISLIVFVILSRLLDPEDFGVMALANVILITGLLGIEQGINQAVVQRAEIREAHLDSAFVLSLLVSLAMASVAVAAAGPLATAFGEPSLRPVVVGIAPAFVLAGLRATQSAVFQRELRFRGLAARSMVAEGVGGIVGIAMAVEGLGVWSLVGQALGRGAAGVVVLWRISGWRPRLRLRLPELRDLAGFGAPVMTGRLVQMVQGKADDVVIGGALGTVALGYYSVGYRLLTYLTTLVVGTVQSVALPVLSRLQASPERLRSAYRQALEYVALASFPVFVGIAVVAPEAIPMILGGRWAPSVVPVQLLALAGAAQVVPTTATTVLTGLGRPSIPLRVNLVVAALGLLGFLALVRFGIAAVATVHLVLALATIPVYAVLLHRLVGVGHATMLRSLARPAIGAALMALVAGEFLKIGGGAPALLRLTLAILAGAVTYAAATFPLAVRAVRLAREAAAGERLPWAPTPLETTEGP